MVISLKSSPPDGVTLLIVFFWNMQPKKGSTLYQKEIIESTKNSIYVKSNFQFDFAG